MKKIMCNQLGGDGTCMHEFMVSSMDELVQQATDHIMNESMHVADKEKMGMQTEEEKQQWMTKTQQLYDAALDV